jgi:hypothetical protein
MLGVGGAQILAFGHVRCHVDTITWYSDYVTLRCRVLWIRRVHSSRHLSDELTRDRPPMHVTVKTLISGSTRATI